MSLTVTYDDASIRVHDGDVDLLAYTFVPDAPQLESPKPYLHPLRTRAGRVVSAYRPWDHVWHKGISWALPVVGDENFWGGPTFVPGRFYVQLPNDGTQQHLGVRQAGVASELATFSHELRWLTEDGRHLFDEIRSLTARVLDEDAWMLTFETEMTNVTGEVIPIGSPTTRGRENAGYGGLFWRGPRSFTGGTVITASAIGSGHDMRGQRHEWMGFEGRHDEIDATSLVVMVDDRANPQHPPQWFVRSEEFACLCPAPFFSEELDVAPGATVRFRYGVGIADGDRGRAASLAARVRKELW